MDVDGQRSSEMCHCNDEKYYKWNAFYFRLPVSVLTHNHMYSLRAAQTEFWHLWDHQLCSIIICHVLGLLICPWASSCCSSDSLLLFRFRCACSTFTLEDSAICLTSEQSTMDIDRDDDSVLDAYFVSFYITVSRLDLERS